MEEQFVDPTAVVSETDAAHSHDSSGGEEEDGWLTARPHQRCVGAASSTATANNESSHGEDYNSEDDDVDMNDVAGPNDFYCKNMDDENEAWVYKHMRSGREELVNLQQRDGTSNHKNMPINDTALDPSSSKSELDKQMGGDSENEKLETSNKNDTQNNGFTHENPQLQQAILLKPRSSDAILSCPRCFNIVCMDCQEHESYANQYRAMFVMNIGVDWNNSMVYDESVGGLKLDRRAGENNDNRLDIPHGRGDATEPDTEPDKIPHDSLEHDETFIESKKELYYPVHCSYCQWDVAALDLKDEVYYFFGCIASS